VNTDEGKLRQVLINLLGNAIKFTEEGGVALRIGAQRHMGGDSDLTFELEDTGPGIAEDEVDRLFSAFEQTRTGIRSGGTGLGLALSKGYVQIMGGSLTLSSAVGKGSIFRFTIPVREESELSVPVKKPRRRVLGLAPGHEGTTVLVADDRDTNRWLLSQMLSFAGFTVREVENGEDAIDAFTRWKPRLILMDMAMPVMDGYEATRRIKALPGGDKTVIVAVTASAFEENRQRIMEAGANGYLSKPFKDTELFAIIGELAGVEYIYQDDGRDSVPREKAGDQEQIRTSVASLPAHLIRGLRDATVSANFDRMNELIHEISQINPSAAGAMRDMALRYEYEDLINLLSTGG
jgi:two-component system sensor histidine kinase/response regulator